MQPENKPFWRWYFASRLSKQHSLLAVLGIIGFLAGIANVLWGIKTHPGAIKPLLPLLKDPFFALSWLILIGSYFDLDYLEFKICKGQPVKVLLGPLERQRMIPKQYEQIYGNDLYLRAWKLRFAFIAFFFIAVIRWMLTWSK